MIETKQKAVCVLCGQVEHSSTCPTQKKKQEKRSIFDLLPFSDEQVEMLTNSDDCISCPLNEYTIHEWDIHRCCDYEWIGDIDSCAKTRSEALRINRLVVELIEKGNVIQKNTWKEGYWIERNCVNNLQIEIEEMNKSIAALKAQQQQTQLDTREQAAEKCISFIRTLVAMGDRFECEWIGNSIDVLNCVNGKVHEFPFE